VIGQITNAVIPRVMERVPARDSDKAGGEKGPGGAVLGLLRLTGFAPDPGFAIASASYI
jgi:hypothetical protein